jgi:hypothetical protein
MALTEIDAMRGPDCLHARQTTAYSFSGTQINTILHYLPSPYEKMYINTLPSPPRDLLSSPSSLIRLLAIHSTYQIWSERRRNASPFRIKAKLYLWLLYLHEPIPPRCGGAAVVLIMDSFETVENIQKSATTASFLHDK